MTSAPRLQHELDATRQRLRAGLEPVLAEFPVSRWTGLVDAQPRIGRYQSESPELMAYDERMRSAHPTLATRYRALALVELMQTSLTRMNERPMTDDIAELCVANFTRITRNLAELSAQTDFDYLELANDRFQKELAASAMRLLSGGARKLHEVRLPIRLAKRHPLVWLRIASRIGPGARLYETHIDSADPQLLAQFNEEGWKQFLRRVVALMDRSGVQGLIATAWYYDPAVAAISPHLAYLRKLIVENGGISIRRPRNLGIVEDALLRSNTRRRLYDEGRYQPTPYTMIWLKPELRRWAASHPERNDPNPDPNQDPRCESSTT